MNSNLIKTYIQMANLLSKQSKCVKAFVGALIVKNGRIISSGVNGTPSGHVNCCELFDETAKDINSENFMKHKTWSSRNEIHAEINALTKAGTVEELNGDFYLFVNKAPCEQCQKMIALYNPIAVYYYDENETISDDSILNEVGIKNVNLFIEKL